MNYDSACPIWGTIAEQKPFPERIHCNSINSPRAGGNYIVDDNVKGKISTLSDHEKVKLTAWLVEQRRLGNTDPEITEEVVTKAQNRKELRVSERVDKILRFLETRSHNLGTRIPFSANEPIRHSPIENFTRKLTYLELLAHSECVSPSELEYLRNYLTERKFLLFLADSQEAVLTVEGYKRVEAIEKVNYDSTKAFIAMWFDDSMNEVLNDGFFPAIKDAGYEPIRIDQIDHNNKIDDKIIAEIRRSRFVVADFTHGNDGARGGVYYEAGFAHGLGIEVIFTCREDMLKKVHFDTRQYNHITWKEQESSKLKNALKDRISAVIGDGPLKSSQ